MLNRYFIIPNDQCALRLCVPIVYIFIWTKDKVNLTYWVQNTSYTVDIQS